MRKRQPSPRMSATARARHGHVGTALLAMGVLGVAACATTDRSQAEVAAIQLAAATDIVGDIVERPGPIAAVCLGYAGDWEDPGLPSVGAGIAELDYMEGCIEVDGRLVARAGGGQAISVSVGAPELAADGLAEVSVHTSTGSVDLAVYSCSVRDRDGAWRSEGCRLEATS